MCVQRKRSGMPSECAVCASGHGVSIQMRLQTTLATLLLSTLYARSLNPSKSSVQLGMEVHAFNLRTWEAEAGGSSSSKQSLQS